MKLSYQNSRIAYANGVSKTADLMLFIKQFNKRIMNVLGRLFKTFYEF